MFATWVISPVCDPRELDKRLKEAPFDLVVLVMSTAVGADTPVFKYLNALSEDDDERARAESIDRSLLTEKEILRLGSRNGKQMLFAALHRAKVNGASYDEKNIRSRGLADIGIYFGTLTVDMDESRQRIPRVKVGMLELWSEPTEADLHALTAWVVMDRIDMLTGYFGSFGAAVSKLAIATHAVSWTPMYQAVKFMGRPLVHPSFWLFFGYYRRITVPDEIPDKLPGLEFGRCIMREMMEMKDVPTWPRNDRGSAFLQNVGNIKMKQITWSRWFEGCFQTCLWLGTSTPSKSSIAKWERKAGKGKGKGKGNGKYEGKGK